MGRIKHITFWPICLTFIILIGIIIKMPSSFTMKIHGDLSSSGASRFFDANLTFQTNKLVYGWQKYEVWPTTGGSETEECLLNITTLDWTNIETNMPCKSWLPLTIKEIQQKIDSGEFKPVNDCGHYDICYEIIK